jgi:hypothetical protein
VRRSKQLPPAFRWNTSPPAEGLRAVKSPNFTARFFHSIESTRRKAQCPTALRALDLAEPRDAQFVTASLVSSGTTRGEPPFAPRNALIGSELGVIAIGWTGSKSLSTSCRRMAAGAAHGQSDANDPTRKFGSEMMRHCCDFQPVRRISAAITGAHLEYRFNVSVGSGRRRRVLCGIQLVSLLTVPFGDPTEGRE